MEVPKEVSLSAASWNHNSSHVWKLFFLTKHKSDEMQDQQRQTWKKGQNTQVISQKVKHYDPIY